VRAAYRTTCRYIAGSLRPTTADSRWYYYHRVITAWSKFIIIIIVVVVFNPLIATLNPQSNGPSRSNTVIGTLAVDRLAVTFGTARRGLGGAAAHTGPSSLYQM